MFASHRRMHLSSRDDQSGRTRGTTASPERTEAFIAHWQGREGGQERPYDALFLTELCDIIGGRY
jgi:hypothetical protein